MTGRGEGEDVVALKRARGAHGQEVNRLMKALDTAMMSRANASEAETLFANINKEFEAVPCRAFEMRRARR